MNIWADRVSTLGTENAFKIGDDIKLCEASGMNVIRLNIGEPDFDSADNIKEKGIEEIRRGNSHYTDPQGILPLRKSIARQVSESRGVPITPEQIVVTSGAKPSIAYTIMAYVNPGDEVIYPSPGFPIYESWVTYMGGTPVPLHLDEAKGFRFDAEDLEKLITGRTKVLIINSPSNPTGGVLSKEDLLDIAAIIREKACPAIRIYSDEIYEEIIFDGRSHNSILSLPEMTSKTILVGGHSKTYAMTGWRLGYSVLPTLEEAMIFRQFNINITSCTPPFIQEAGREAMENRENLSVIACMVREFQSRRDVAIEGLNGIEGVSCAKPEGAFYAFPNIGGACEALGVIEAHESLPPEIRRNTSPSTLFQMFLLYHHGVAALDRRSFGVIGSEGKHYLRLSLATDMASLKEGIARIAVASKDREGFGRFIEGKEHLY